MAISMQQAPQRPKDEPRSPRYAANPSRNLSRFSPNPSINLHHGTKKRKLNHPTPVSGSQTSASSWFDTVNQNVKASMQSNADIDREHVRSTESPPLTLYAGEPPFFLNWQDDGPTPAQMSTDPSFEDVQARVTKEDSENEDLRSVIDDLTIENKRLRQMLRERRPQYSPLLDHDKIFEVRTCGLSSEKKLELEVILQRFATTMGNGSSAPSKTLEDGSAPEGGSCTFPERTTQKSASYPHADSAYASLSNSGLTTAGQSKRTNAEMQRIRGSKNSNVKSYLQDIPDSLLPKHPPVMSEKSKMRLVVKRLEQLFTGKNAAPGEHSQPLQQQKVSESAAYADRHHSQLLKQYIRPEGAREAHILPIGAKMGPDLPQVNSSCKQPLGSRSQSEKSSSGSSASDNREPDQRPTRPLDLDIQRAQVAQENIEYIRHLGLATPTRQRDCGHDDDGWVYLNLLINMAQLHTINVTPAFVRKSIAHLSTKFELSKDARKVRWRAGFRGTDSSEDSDSGAELITGSSPEQIPDSMADKLTSDNAVSDNLASTSSSRAQARRPLESLPSERNPFTDSAEPSMQPSQVTGRSRPESAFDYKPMFLRDCAMLQDNDLLDDSDTSPSVQGADESTGQYLSTHTNGIGHSFPGRSEEDGPIIYYKNPLFYCDMSGDKDEQAHQRGTTMIPSAPKQILGVSIWEARLGEEPQEDSLTHAEDTGNCSVNDGRLPSLELAPLSDIVDNQSTLMELSASGIGGVIPEDHFMLQVQRKRQYAPSQRRAHAIAHPRSNQLSPTFEETVSSRRVDLPASKLPPPSYVFFSLSSGSSGGPESDEFSSGDPDASEAELLEEGQPGQPALLKRFSLDTSCQRCATDEYDAEVDSCNSPKVDNSLEDPDPYIHADQRFGFGRGAVLYRPLGILTGSVAATAGAGSAASVASNCSAASSRGSRLERDTRAEYDL